MFVRAAKESDLPRLYPLVCAAAGRPLPQEVFAAICRGIFADRLRRLVVATEGEELLGYGELQARLDLARCCVTAEVCQLYVRPENRGARVGTALLLALFREGKILKADRLMANCSRVDLKNQAFFERHGFVRSMYQYEKPIK